ncbi:MAG TPA: hypothetical protein ENI87_10720 [bacterium]|nr:hypothetical protein [bacterium]
MDKLRSSVLASWLLLAACGGSHPLAGSWSEVTADGKPGMTIEFDADSDAIAVHLAPRPDGGHGHAGGELKYAFDGQTGAVTVRAELLGRGKPSTWTGKLSGDRLELGAADTKLQFQRGGEVHH